MTMKTRAGSGTLALAVLLAIGSLAAAQQAAGPAESLMEKNPQHFQRVLIGPMEPGDGIGPGGWRMTDLTVVPAVLKADEAAKAKVGRHALVFSGNAEIAGAKGDFTVHGQLPGKAGVLGLWVYLEPNANVDTLGIQVYDAQGEALMMLVPADWSGWKWVEFATAGEHVRQSYPQPDKNGTIDQPLKSENVVWFAKAPGETRLIVDGMTALVDRSGLADAADLTVDALAGGIVEPGQPIPASVLLVNYSEQPIAVDLNYSVQRDSSLYSTPLPDPVDGSNHAPGLKSWIVADGEKVEDGSLTDGQPWTDSGTDYKANHFTEAFQYVELDKLRRITKMTWLSGDANHTWLVDVDASRDGSKFEPVAGLQNVDQYKKWGWQNFPLSSPFEAKVVRFRYHTENPETKVPAIRFPCELGIYDGVADETIVLPRVGPVLDEGRVQATVPAKSFRLESLPVRRAAESGACLVGIEAAWPGHRVMTCGHVFSALKADPALVSPESRLGLNAAHGPLAPKLRDLGIGWVRFENMKWPFASPEPHKYGFDGSVAPWRLNLDEIFQGYHRNGLNVLSYMFLTPQYASSAPEGTKEDRVTSFPPKDLSLFGEFCFQVAARYGNTQHPAEALLSNDKKSGLGLVHYYEMWNEPNLNPQPTAAWGGWSASMDEYYKMMRYGAEAVKKADPTATVTSAGYAGMQAEIVDRMRTYKYPDGKCPLDFVQVINVHYYSGRTPPEIATEDGNANLVGATTFVQDLEELTAWRDRYAPQMPIWMTETGYDSDGPFGTTETIQAARLPRVVMLCLANGVEKVMVYRESGSTASMHACSGVLRDDFTEKPSWFTFGTLVRQFRGVKGGAVRLPHPDPNVWLLKWDDGGKPMLTAWTVNGNARLGIDLGRCEITDAFGARLDAEHTADLALTQFPLYLRGMDASPAWKTLLAAYDVEQRELKQRRDRATACRKQLYDFGGPDRVGDQLIEGIKFPYTPVKAADVWDEARGYGFNVPAMSDENRAWLRSKLDGDGCRIRDGVQFRFRVEPGDYHLSIGFSPQGDAPNVSVEGLSSPLALPVDKKQNVTETDLTVTTARDAGRLLQRLRRIPLDRAGREALTTRKDTQLKNDHFAFIRVYSRLIAGHVFSVGRRTKGSADGSR